MVSDGTADAPETFTIYDAQPAAAAKIAVRRLPRLCRQALRIVWSAGRAELLVVTLLQLLTGGGLAAMLLIGRAGLDALLGAVRDNGSLRTVLPWVLALAAVSTVQMVATAVQRERQQILVELVGRHVEQQVLDIATAVDLTAFETPAFHNRLQRITIGGHQAMDVVHGLSGLLRSAIGVIGVLVALVAIEPALVPLVVLVFFPAWVGASRRGEAFFRFYFGMTPRDRERGYLMSILTGRDSAKEVRAFDLAAYLRRRWERLFDERINELREVSRRQLWFSLAANVASGAILAATLLVVAWLAVRGTVSLASAGVAVAAVAIASERLTMAGYSAGALAEASLYVQDYAAFVEMLPEIERREPTAAGPSSLRRIDVDNVSFTYPTGETPALQDVSLTIAEGEIVALVGENGSGKTTLAKLLAGLYRPDEGSIRWDGVDISTVDRGDLSRAIAPIFQDFVRFHLPARDNIALGRVDSVDDLERITNAAQYADADAFITQLPQGYDTMLGPEFEGGTDLSVGQWQRIALARAFFRGAPFVILDEPTASLDARAEHDLFERIRDLLAGRTVLLISHRFSSVRGADRIYVLDGGRVVESGTHDQLMADTGLYAELFSLQAAAYLTES